jgi:tetratricopeptide (TPR) repeat protein
VKIRNTSAILAAGGVLACVLAVEKLGAQRAGASEDLSTVTIDYPPAGAVFPPEFPPVVFRWRDLNSEVKAWRIRISFADGSPAVEATTPGERMRVGAIDTRAVAELNQPPELTAEEAAGWIWTPAPELWKSIERHSRTPGATLTITGLGGAAGTQPVSTGHSTFLTSDDPVGAPIFYRDVPLIPSQSKGEVGILPKEAISLIQWRLRDVSQPQSRMVMTGLATCANCHSFSADGKTMGMDIDGPMNDKSLYAVVPLRKNTEIRNADVFKWNTPASQPGGRRLRAGFMSQVSPDGKFILTTLDERDPMALNQAYGLQEKYYFAVYKDYRFGQVFFPTRGILVWREVATGRTEPLPGADDPAYVQTDGVWSPDGKWIVFARAEAKTAFPPGAPPALYANDPNETQIQYNLYRIPFNQGKGGKAEPVAGASANGISNSFPKITPDGRWIVYVRCKNGQLMRPDSRLYIVPFAGGESRPLQCNTRQMNSWHSFSPNGRWMVFSSKARSPYTQLYLTHFDPDGNDSPAILLENSTAANRAANIPEFVNIAPAALETLAVPASDFYKVFDTATELMTKGRYAESIAEWRTALELDPDDERVRVNLGSALDHEGQLEEAAVHYRKAIEIAPEHAPAYDNLALDMLRQGKLDEAIEAYTKSLAIAPANLAAQGNLGTALYQQGRLEEAIDHCRKALEMDPAYADAHNTLGLIFSRQGRLDDAISHLEAAVARNSNSFQYQNNLGRVLAQKGRFEDAIPHMERAVELSGEREPVAISLLAAMYAEVNRLADAISSAHNALEMAQRLGDRELAATLTARIARYEARLAAGR